LKGQEEGQEFYVVGVGLFKVQWHLLAYMRTIKALYGLQGDANAKHSGIYCLQEKTKATITLVAQIETLGKKYLPF